MTRRLVAIAVVVAAMGLTPTALAEPGDAPAAREAVHLSLPDALALAKRNPPAVLAALARASAAAAQVEVVRSVSRPRIDGNLGLSASATQTEILYGESNIPEGLVFPGIVPTAAVDASIALRWQLWDFGRTRFAIEAAQLGVTAAAAEARSAEREAMLQVAAAYLTVLSDDELVAQTRETARKREHEAELAKELVANGTRAPFEQMRTEVALESARTDLVVVEGHARRDAVSLASALALDPTRRLRLSPPESPSVDAGEAHATESALAARPEVAAAHARLAQAERQLAAARAGYRPLLSAHASLGGRYVNRITSDAVSGYGAASVLLSVPFLDPAVQAEVRANEAEVAAASAEAQRVRLAVQSEAVQASIALATARAMVAQAERVALAAATALVQAQGRYRSGSAALVELLDAQAADAMARVGVVRAQLGLELSTVQLLSATGHLDGLANGNGRAP